MSSRNSKPTTSNDSDKDDDDYMSDSFLEQISDTRPGLVYSKSLARKYEIEKKSKVKIEEHKKEHISVKKLEEINREKALAQSTLVSGNKGYDLMLKMGYKDKEGLGIRKNADRPTEPIKVVIKTGREGLGIGIERKKKLEEIENLRKKFGDKRKQNEEVSAKIYIDTKRSQFKLRKIRHSFHKTQRVCFQLDSTVGNVKVPELKWYWPIAVRRSLKADENKDKSLMGSHKKQKSDAEPQIEISSDKSHIENNQLIEEKEIHSESDNSNIDLRKVYDDRMNKFLNEDEKKEEVINKKSDNDENSEELDDDDDDDDFCFKKKTCTLDSVNYREEDTSDRDIDSDDDDEEEQKDEENEEILNKKTEAICAYLREKYNYCVWCACKYESEEELNSNCPGLTENDHENDE